LELDNRSGVVGAIVNTTRSYAVDRSAIVVCRRYFEECLLSFANTIGAVRGGKGLRAVFGDCGGNLPRFGDTKRNSGTTNSTFG
jgi:hypothetical protein